MDKSALKNLIKSGAIHLPWPTAIDGDVCPNTQISLHSFCEKCDNRTCLKPDKQMTPLVCHKGLSFYQSVINNSQVVVFGVIDRNRPVADRQARHLRRVSKGRNIQLSDFQQWLSCLDSLNRVVVLMTAESEQAGWKKAADQMLHDPPKLIRAALQAADDVYGDPGSSEWTKNNNKLKTLHNLIRMASDSLAVATICSNPEVITFDKQMTTEIYKVLDKIRVVVEWAYKARRKRVRINFQGNTHRKFKIFPMFTLLPHVLLDNAVKYSERGDVDLIVDDSENDSVEVSVCSEGPLIKQSEIQDIFLKERRGEWGKKHTQEGGGIGLYVAKIIASKHGMEISVESNEIKRRSSSGVPMAKNIFSFTMKDGW